jgi:hypothetical protein
LSSVDVVVAQGQLVAGRDVVVDAGEELVAVPAVGELLEAAGVEAVLRVEDVDDPLDLGLAAEVDTGPADREAGMGAAPRQSPSRRRRAVLDDGTAMLAPCCLLLNGASGFSSGPSPTMASLR